MRCGEPIPERVEVFERLLLHQFPSDKLPCAIRRARRDEQLSRLLLRVYRVHRQEAPFHASTEAHDNGSIDFDGPRKAVRYVLQMCRPFALSRLVPAGAAHSSQRGMSASGQSAPVWIRLVLLAAQVGVTVALDRDDGAKKKN